MTKYGLNDFSSDYRKRYKDTPYYVNRSTYREMVNSINKTICKYILQGKSISLPYKFGSIELRKFPAILYMKDGKVTTNLPVDWKGTKELWESDEEAKRNKTLIRLQEDYIYKLFYNKRRARYKGQWYYNFRFKRDLKRALTKAIKETDIDAALLGKV